MTPNSHTQTGYYTDDLVAIARQGLSLGEPAITLEEVCELFRALMTVPEFVELAASDVRPEHFDPHDALEQQMAQVWDAFLSLLGENNATPTITAVVSELGHRLNLEQQSEDVNPAAITAALAEGGLVASLNHARHSTATLAQFQSLLQRFLREREVIDPLLRIARSASSPSWNGIRTLPDNINRLIHRASEQLVEIDSRFGSGDDWGDLVPLGINNLPVFPVEVLPAALRDWVQAEAIATQTPTDLPAMLALSVVSAASAGKFRVGPSDEYTEPVNIYTATVLDSANRKSAVFSHAMAPLLEAEHREVDLRAPQVREYERNKRILEKRIKKSEENAAKASDERDQQRNCEFARQADEELASLQPCTMPKFVIDDCTIEKVAMILAEQGGKIAVMNAEGGIFDLMAGRYNRGQPNFEVFLKGHSGDQIRVDRVGQNRPPIFVEIPSITMGLAVQPEVIRGLGRIDQMRGRGLPARVLFAIPESPLGQRDPSPQPMPDAIREAYRRTVLQLCAVRDIGEARQLRFSAEANQRLTRFQAEHEPSLGVTGRLVEIRDWAGKLPGAVVRLSGLLHLVRQTELHYQTVVDEHEREVRIQERQRGVDFRPWESEIAVGVIEAAIAIAAYLTPHAEAAFKMMGMATGTASGVLADSIHTVSWLRHGERRTFSRRDLQQANRSRFAKPQQIDAVIHLLIDHNFIRRMISSDGTRKAGRPAEKFQVNPQVFEGDLTALIPN
jgi:hypothetical protein